MMATIYVLKWGNSPVAAAQTRKQAEEDNNKYCRGEATIHEVSLYYYNNFETVK